VQAGEFSSSSGKYAAADARRLRAETLQSFGLPQPVASGRPASNPTYLERMSINYLERGISKSHARIVERIRWGMRSSESENDDSIIAEAEYENSTSSKPTPR